MIILLLVFLMNIFVLIYFLFHRGLVTDFSEPPNLFALAVNSPPSHLFAGSCGGGPEGKQYVVNWFVNTEGDHLYMEPGQEKLIAANAAHVHTHAHPHPHTHAHPHPNTPLNVHGPPSASSQNKPGAISSFFSGVTASLNRLREHGLQSRQKQEQTRLRPVSVVETDYELEDGVHSKTAKQYRKLANRRSIL